MADKWLMWCNLNMLNLENKMELVELKLFNEGGG
jgi:hypothetical protein